MGITRITIELPDNILEKLDEEAKNLMAQESRPSQFEWLNGSPEGKELLIDITCRGKYNRLSNIEMNSMIRKMYTDATGGVKMGRPALGAYRSQVIAKLVQSMVLSPIAVRKQVKQWNFADGFGNRAQA